MRTKTEIFSDVHALLEELYSLGTSGSPNSKVSPKVNKGERVNENKYSGCMGGITYLKDQEFFSTPRSVKEVTAELGKEGWHYTLGLTSMNLLNLTRQRVFSRIQDSKKGWLYVIRK
jgi:hypothetical protein